jgi:hypothetical protein
MPKYGDGSKYGSGVKYAKAGTPVVPPSPPPLDFGRYKQQQRKDRIMNDRDAARYDAMKRTGDFGVENAALFQPVPPATGPTLAQQLFAALGVSTDDPDAGSTTLMARIKKATTGRQSAAGGFHGGTTSKAVVRDGLVADLRGINRSAEAIALANGTPEILANFPLPYGLNDPALLAQARAVAAAAEPMKAAFIALEHPADFVEALLGRVAEFENADSGQNVGQENQRGATASLGPLIQEGMTILKQLDAIMSNKFRSNAEMMGKWLTASHVERAAVSHRKQQSPPPPPTPPAA